MAPVSPISSLLGSGATGPSFWLEGWGPEGAPQCLQTAVAMMEVPLQPPKQPPQLLWRASVLLSSEEAREEEPVRFSVSPTPSGSGWASGRGIAILPSPTPGHTLH